MCVSVSVRERHTHRDTHAGREGEGGGYSVHVVQKKTFESQFSASTIWVLEIELSS